jgi:hypothetical protein
MTNTRLIKEILLGTAALVFCATAMAAGPSRDELTALLASPTSDWTVRFPNLNYEGAAHNGPITEGELSILNEHVNEENILHQVADLDAMAYFKTHTTATDIFNAIEVGKAHAFKHNLIGGAATMYGQDFGHALDVLYTN